jgi:hypothetical protein
MRSGEETVFEEMPTLFGRASLRFQLSKDAQSLNVSFRGDWHEKPRRVVLHSPPGLSTIVANGKRHLAGKEIEIV